MTTPTLPPSTIRAAVRSAECTVTVYKKGSGYVVSALDADADAWRVSDPMPWPMAIERKRVAVIARALQRLGMDLVESFDVASNARNARRRPEDVVARAMVTA